MPTKLGELMAFALAASQDQARTQRALWAGVASVISVVFTLLGSAYAVGGIRVEPESRPYALLLLAPGGMCVWGVLMLALGLALAYGLLAPLYGRPLVLWWLRRALLCTFGFSLFMGVEFIGSGSLTGSWSAAGIAWWFASAVLSWLLVKLPPPVSARCDNTGGGRSGRARRRAVRVRTASDGRSA